MKKYVFLLCALISIGCTYDYDIGDDIANFKPQVVVNSIIHPAEQIRADLYWSRHYTEEKEFKKVSNFSAEVYEDDVLMAKMDAVESVVFEGVYPKVGRKYRLKITVPNYGEVTAQTVIPTPASANGAYIYTNGSGYRTYQHLKIDRLVSVEKTRALWIRCFAEYENDSVVMARELYSNTPFADQVNAVLDATDATSRGSNVGFEHFMRVPYQTVAMITPLEFSVWLSRTISEYIRVENEDDRPLDENGNPLYYYNHKMKWIRVDAIAPSEDYDRYFKTRYRQNMLDFEPDMPFVGESVPVYSNIKNGLGIFAGYSVTSLKLTGDE